MTKVAISQILPNPEQPRKTFDPQALAELAESIRTIGLIQPVTVEGPYERITGDGEVEERYILIAGERRVRACKQLGMNEIEAYITPPGRDDGAGRLRKALVENVQRAEMNPIDIAMAYARLRDEYGFTTEQIAEYAGVSLATIYNYLFMLKLEPEIQDLFRAGKLPLAREVTQGLISLPDDKRVRVATNLAIRGATIQSIRMTCKRLSSVWQETPPELDVTDETNPALRFAFRKGKPDRPAWDAIAQLGQVPPWKVLEEAARATCDWCTIRESANDSICKECPLVDAIRRMIKRVGVEE